PWRRSCPRCARRAISASAGRAAMFPRHWKSSNARALRIRRGRGMKRWGDLLGSARWWRSEQHRRRRRRRPSERQPSQRSQLFKILLNFACLQIDDWPSRTGNKTYHVVVTIQAEDIVGTRKERKRAVSW